MTDNDIERALDKALEEAQPRAVARTVSDANTEHIERIVAELRVREQQLKDHLEVKMEDLRLTQRTIKAYELALRLLP